MEEEEDKKYREIELRSEEVQEVMGRIPPWIERWGITLLCGIVVVLLIGSCFFRYPDTITTEMTLTGQQPVAQIVARYSGKISNIYVSDGTTVCANTLLAIIENPASTEDMHLLEKVINKYKNQPDSLDYSLSMQKEWVLGDVQAIYTTFLSSLHEYINYQTLDYYPQKIAVTQGQIAKYQNYYQNLERQRQITNKKGQIAQEEYSRDSALYKRGVISLSDHETAKSTLLNSRSSLEQSDAALDQLKITIGELKGSLLDLELNRMEKEISLKQNYNSSFEQLLNAIQGWKLTYCLISPIDGKITFTNYWSENQTVSSGDNVFTVVPTKEEKFIGKALLPLARSGKVKVGQRVIVRFNNFPDKEFGMVNGEVSKVSLVPSEDNYIVEIDFPDGLTTNYNRTLPLSPEMKASAEIVTEDLRLIERFIMPIKKILRGNLKIDKYGKDNSENSEKNK